jgi:hypothetical protein
MRERNLSWVVKCVSLGKCKRIFWLNTGNKSSLSVQINGTLVPETELEWHQWLFHLFPLPVLVVVDELLPVYIWQCRHCHMNQAAKCTYDDSCTNCARFITIPIQDKSGFKMVTVYNGDLNTRQIEVRYSNDLVFRCPFTSYEMVPFRLDHFWLPSCFSPLKTKRFRPVFKYLLFL